MTTAAPLANPSESDLANAVQENLFELFRAMAHALAGAEIVERNGLSYHHAFPSNPMFKGVWRTRLAPDQIDAAIDETLAWFAERKAPFLFWWTGPGTTPADLGALAGTRAARHGRTADGACVRHQANGAGRAWNGG
jgi:hypothetical protein